jgi:hypothetical protein
MNRIKMMYYFACNQHEKSEKVELNHVLKFNSANWQKAGHSSGTMLEMQIDAIASEFQAGVLSNILISIK